MAGTSNMRTPEEDKAWRAAYNKWHHKVYNDAHPEEKKARDAKYGAIYCARHPEIHAAAHIKRQNGLGYNALNSWFEGSNGHHINLNDVIHIPEGLHHSVAHNVFTGANMATINLLAGAYYTEGWT